MEGSDTLAGRFLGQQLKTEIQMWEDLQAIIISLKQLVEPPAERPAMFNPHPTTAAHTQRENALGIRGRTERLDPVVTE